jgi:hypothetical protein
MSEAVRPAFDAVAVARDATAHGLVVVAGAGLSMGPPSSLPGWTAINNAFLENLALRLAAHTGGEVGYDVAEFVLERRETADVAQPDLQAQLAEESLGEQYFALFKPLDIATWNDGHAAIAALAATGFYAPLSPPTSTDSSNLPSTQPARMRASTARPMISSGCRMSSWMGPRRLRSR